jgi:formylmethanofuran dehydrogenase subunit E
MTVDTTKKCLIIHGPSADPIVIEQPESKYESNTEYRCQRCGESFSSPWLTQDVDSNTCWAEQKVK